MPTLRITQNRRSYQVSLANFRRQYPDTVLSEVSTPWARRVVAAVQRQTRRPRNRTGNLRRQFTFQTGDQGGNVFIRFFSRARSNRGFPYWIAQQYGTRHGVPATDFIGRAVRGERRELTNMLERATQEQVRRSF